MESSTGRLVAAEALSRLHAEDGRMISPAVFIPIAEKSGSIIALGEQVLRKTCRFIRDNDIAALGLQWINVNLSPYQCMSPTLAERFKAILEEYGVAPALIHLELTEQSIADYELIKPQLLDLEEIGFQFALDDYGSGASNLTRVKQFPFKNIKIDMEVVRNYFRDRDPLLPTLVQVFRQMDFSITAEGIETKEMAEGMREIGCDYLQGFYFSQPVPMQAFLQLYAKKSSTGAPAESVRKP
jgi:EAL domain-containing protein (putative c-di-GMP-specific phosphodiesterase class I)